MRWSLWCLAEVLTALPRWACSDFLVVIRHLAVSLNGGWSQRTRSGSSGALKYLNIIDQLRAQTHKCNLHRRLLIVYCRTIVLPKSIPIASVNHPIDRAHVHAARYFSTTSVHSDSQSHVLGIDSPKPQLCKGWGRKELLLRNEAVPAFSSQWCWDRAAAERLLCAVQSVCANAGFLSMGKFVRKSKMKGKVGWLYLLSVRFSTDSSRRHFNFYLASVHTGVSKDADCGNDCFALRETFVQSWATLQQH